MATCPGFLGPSNLQPSLFIVPPFIIKTILVWTINNMGHPRNNESRGVKARISSGVEGGVGRVWGAVKSRPQHQRSTAGAKDEGSGAELH